MPTIVPRTAEADWMSKLQGLPLWNPPLVLTVVLAPHPDDETLGAGGLITHLRARKVSVTIVSITDGENAYGDTVKLGKLRTLEQTKALRRLGVPESSVFRLGLPDRDVSLHEERLLQLLRALVSHEMHIVAPWPFDFHPDHEAVGRVAERLAGELGLTLSFYLFWTWHRGDPEFIDNLPLVAFRLSESEREIKLHALEAHQSQLAHADGQPILSSELLEPARRRFEVYIR